MEFKNGRTNEQIHIRILALVTKDCGIYSLQLSLATKIGYITLSFKIPHPKIQTHKFGSQQKQQQRHFARLTRYSS